MWYNIFILYERRLVKISQRGRGKVIYMNNELRKIAEEYCETTEISFSKLVNDVLIDFLEKKGIVLDERNDRSNS